MPVKTDVKTDVKRGRNWETPSWKALSQVSPETLISFNCSVTARMRQILEALKDERNELDFSKILSVSELIEELLSEHPDVQDQATRMRVSLAARSRPGRKVAADR